MGAHSLFLPGCMIVTTLIVMLFCNSLQHTTMVNQISIDDTGDYIASCSDDGRVGPVYLTAVKKNVASCK